MSLTLQVIDLIALKNNQEDMVLQNIKFLQMQQKQKKNYKVLISMAERLQLILASEISLASQLRGVILVRNAHLLLIIGLTVGAHIPVLPQAGQSRIGRVGGTISIMKRSADMSGHAHAQTPTEDEDPTQNHPEDDIYPKPTSTYYQNQLFVSALQPKHIKAYNSIQCIKISHLIFKASSKTSPRPNLL